MLLLFINEIILFLDFSLRSKKIALVIIFGINIYNISLGFLN